MTLPSDTVASDRLGDRQRRTHAKLAAVLQFPYYFGENWSAVRDCITDLNWLEGSSFLVVFESLDRHDPVEDKLPLQQ